MHILIKDKPPFCGQREYLGLPLDFFLEKKSHMKRKMASSIHPHDNLAAYKCSTITFAVADLSCSKELISFIHLTILHVDI
jgi:hypothetical protein